MRNPVFEISQKSQCFKWLYNKTESGFCKIAQKWSRKVASPLKLNFCRLSFTLASSVQEHSSPSHIHFLQLLSIQMTFSRKKIPHKKMKVQNNQSCFIPIVLSSKNSSLVLLLFSSSSKMLTIVTEEKKSKKTFQVNLCLILVTPEKKFPKKNPFHPFFSAFWILGIFFVQIKLIKNGKENIKWKINKP